MQPVFIDLILVVLILVMTYSLYAEGLWGAALVFFNVLFAGMIALNFYEPLARLLAENASGIASFADVLCLGGLFIVSLMILKLLIDTIAPTYVRIPGLVDQLGRIAFGAGGALVTAGMLLLIFHTAPVHRQIFGVVDYQTGPPFGWGLDRKLLAFFQYATGNPFADYGSGRDDPDFGTANVFDPRGSWLIDRQNARPFPADSPEGLVPEPEAAPEVGAGGGGGEGGMPGGMPGG